MAKDGIDRSKYRPMRQSKLNRRIDAVVKFCELRLAELEQALSSTTDAVERDVLEKLLRIRRSHGRLAR